MSQALLQWLSQRGNVTVAAAAARGPALQTGGTAARRAAAAQASPPPAARRRAQTATGKARDRTGRSLGAWPARTQPLNANLALTLTVDLVWIQTWAQALRSVEMRTGSRPSMRQFKSRIPVIKMQGVSTHRRFDMRLSAQTASECWGSFVQPPAAVTSLV